MMVIRAITVMKDYNLPNCHKGHNATRVTMIIKSMRPTRAMMDTRAIMGTELTKYIRTK